ncbi:hypothetical protein [Bartonella sp. AU18XJBT]|uniref:hypothetical protein n=1 Tax=Bartonella sp. AU18XJBT TaxID=3019089 RepID=UPI002361CD05|nr:hypothetical protein [Bartonella sp. AU18XJBT]
MNYAIFSKKVFFLCESVLSFVFSHSLLSYGTGFSFLSCGTGFSLSSLDSKEYNIFSLELWNKIFFLLSLGSNGERTGWWDTPLFLSLYAFWKVIIVCVLVLFPVILILGIILWFLLVKNIRKLKGINQQRGKITDQKDRYKESVNWKMDDILVMIFVFVLMCVTLVVAFIPMMILELYYGVFKQVRTYRKVRRVLKRVRKESDQALL